MADCLADLLERVADVLEVTWIPADRLTSMTAALSAESDGDALLADAATLAIQRELGLNDDVLDDSGLLFWLRAPERTRADVVAVVRAASRR